MKNLFKLSQVFNKIINLNLFNKTKDQPVLEQPKVSQELIQPILKPEVANKKKKTPKKSKKS
jgi:hypothetical protein